MLLLLSVWVFFFKCYIWIYYTVCKNLKAIATQQLLTHCFSEIILQVLRNSLITSQRGFLWKSEISCCWGFLPGFVLVSVFLRNVSHMKCTPAKALWEVKDVLFRKPQSLGVAEIGICGASADEIWYWSILAENQTSDDPSFEGVHSHLSYVLSLPLSCRLLVTVPRETELYPEFPDMLSIYPGKKKQETNLGIRKKWKSGHWEERNAKGAAAMTSSAEPQACICWTLQWEETFSVYPI